MGTRNLNRPITLQLNSGRLGVFRAHNAADALDYLKRFWSGSRTREYRRAYAICQSALDDLVSAESARAYLVAAAEGAGVLYRQRDHSPATTIGAASEVRASAHPY